MKLRSSVAAVLLVTCHVAIADRFGAGNNQFDMSFVTIPADSNPDSGYGIVHNDYRIARYEVTNNQWNMFKALLGVPVTGSPANAYDLAESTSQNNHPISRVSVYEAAQFVNWLNTSSGYHAAYKFTGTQGTSNYTLAVWSPSEAAGGWNRFRHKDALYFLPTEHEWVKAAYWNGTNLQAWSTPGDIEPVAQAHANFDREYPYPGGTTWTVGSGDEEINGTYDMMGNVEEWMEDPYNAGQWYYYASRAVRGGSFNSAQYDLPSTRRFSFSPHHESFSLGIRIASLVPPDCNENTIADHNDISSGTSDDCNLNLIPDECEADSDSDGLIDGCDPCAGGAATGDIDGNGQVDLADYLNLAACLAGPNYGFGVGCECLDFNQDGDADLADFAVLQRILDP